MVVTHHIKELFKDGICQVHTLSTLKQYINTSMVTISGSENIKNMQIADKEGRGKW